MPTSADLLERPEPPASNECCGSGCCCPCVWDDYRDKLKQWQNAQSKAASEVTQV